MASLDPLARREFLQILMETVAEQGVSVVLSSHLVADLERVCDYLVVLVASRVQIAGPVDDLLAEHRRLIGARRDPTTLPANQEVIESSHTERQSTFLIRTTDPILDPAWTVEEVGLEDLVLAYMGQAASAARNEPDRLWGSTHDLADAGASSVRRLRWSSACWPWSPSSWPSPDRISSTSPTAT